MQDKLHIGCGTVIKEDWCNVDSWLPDCVKLFWESDLTGRVWTKGSTTFILQRSPQDLTALQASSFSEIYSCHFLEHLHPQIAYEMMGEFQRLLIPGVGKMHHIVPDFDSVIRMWAGMIGSEGVFDYERYMTLVNMTLCPFLFSDSYPQHKGLWGKRYAEFLLQRWGFDGIEVEVKGTDLHLCATSPSGVYNSVRD